MKYCQKCGAQNADNANFCIECGSTLTVSESTYTYTESASDETTILEPVYNYGGESSSKPEDNYQYSYNTDNTAQETYSTVHPGIAPRNIVVAVILSLVTCGIYQIYWMIKLNDEVNDLANEPNATSGGLVFLFSLITCGIYGIFWMYKMGEKCDRIKGAVGGSSHILYLILSLVGLGIVNYCLIQDTINKAI